MNLPLLSAADVMARLDAVEAADALEAALLSGLDPEADPPRGVLELGGGELLVMPSAAGGHAAVKLVTVGGEPRVQGVCVVFDGATLAPVALIDGIALTNLRTPAVSALAVRRLANPDARRLVVFGRGPQALAHAVALRAVRPIDNVEIIGRERGGAVDELVAAADVICCATTAREPLFDGGLVAAHAVVVAIGSHEPGARETDDALARRATVVVESLASALREAGDVIAALSAGAVAEDELVTLSDLVCGHSRPGPPAPVQEHGHGLGGRRGRRGAGGPRVAAPRAGETNVASMGL